MLPDRVSNPGPLAIASNALPTALRNSAINYLSTLMIFIIGAFYGFYGKSG